MVLFEKILIANRGEIAVRIIKSAKKIGIKTVAVFSPADKNALHVKMADEAFALNSNDLSQSYLDIDKIIDIARRSKSDAIHPGYGFLAENAKFVEACDHAEIKFIGPKADTIRLMGNKIEARAFVDKIGVPMTKGITGSTTEILDRADELNFPVLIKAAAGGGGKGMRIIHDRSELEDAIESTSREALSYFGDAAVYVEKFIENPRHIEVQVIGDNHGNVVHLFERECSIQRRYQKIIEESPASILDDELRLKIAQSAVDIARAVNYTNAGTIEFLVDKDFNYYFLEMNTRIQVEHPVTELVTGIDIVEEQIIIAAGNPMRLNQNKITQTGHAIECRIYAEDPCNDFMPSPGDMMSYQEPGGPHIRIDSALDSAATIESSYDPMISKLIVSGDNRDLARQRMVNALKEYHVHGIKTNISYLIEILNQDAYIDNAISTKYCDQTIQDITLKMEQRKEELPVHIPLITYALFSINKKRFKNPENIWERIGYWREQMSLNILLDANPYELEIKHIHESAYQIILNDKNYSTELREIKNNLIELIINGYHILAFISCDKKGNSWLDIEGIQYHLTRTDILPEEMDINDFAGDTEKSGNIKSPMPGKVVKINIKEGDKVKEGDLVLIVESMKMENNLLAAIDGVVREVNTEVGEMVDSNSTLVLIKEE